MSDYQVSSDNIPCPSELISPIRRIKPEEGLFGLVGSSKEVEITIPNEGLDDNSLMVINMDIDPPRTILSSITLISSGQNFKSSCDYVVMYIDKNKKCIYYLLIEMGGRSKENKKAFHQLCGGYLISELIHNALRVRLHNDFIKYERKVAGLIFKKLYGFNEVRTTIGIDKYQPLELNTESELIETIFNNKLYSVNARELKVHNLAELLKLFK